MLVTIQGNSRVVFVVKSYEPCRAVYERSLELPIHREWDRGPGDRGAIYVLGTFHLELLEGDRDPTGEGIYLCVPVENVDALWARLTGSTEVIDPIETQPWGHRNFTIRDPSGAKIKFFSPAK